MKTPEEFYEDAGFDTHPSAMTETALVIAMMRQYAEYYHKNLATDEVSSRVSEMFIVWTVHQNKYVFESLHLNKESAEKKKKDLETIGFEGLSYHVEKVGVNSR